MLRVFQHPWLIRSQLPKLRQHFRFILYLLQMFATRIPRQALMWKPNLRQFHARRTRIFSINVCLRSHFFRSRINESKDSNKIRKRWLAPQPPEWMLSHWAKSFSNRSYGPSILFLDFSWWWKQLQANKKHTSNSKWRICLKKPKTWFCNFFRNWVRQLFASVYDYQFLVW